MIYAWGVTDKGVVRQQNQDGFYLDVPAEQVAVGVVCDGMGGANAGNVASLLAVETFVSSLQSITADMAEGPALLLERAAEQANSAVFHRAAVDADCRGMGTTMVAALIVEHTAYLLNIGDSRAYYICGGGIERVTRDHSLVEDMVERGQITPEEARTHPRKNLITRALGSEAHVRADLYEKQMEVGDYLLLCSDGLSNLITEQELLFEVLHGGEAAECCQRLLDMAISRGAPDNVTVVLFEIV